MFANKRKLALTVVTVVLAFLIAYLSVSNLSQARQLHQLRSELAAQKTNVKVINFIDLFIQKVLRVDKEVSFEDRLRLENTVRDIGDENILATWEQFTSAQTEDQIQDGVKDLLEALVKKINY